jgi:hypothetical protein
MAQHFHYLKMEIAMIMQEQVQSAVLQLTGLINPITVNQDNVILD